ncbi:MAG: J domain-containing protein [Aquificaceae bacterium]|nr:MAG: J domain-containing protein [Aquificaceae bacterium]
MDYKDYYKILNVKKTANKDEIKKSYRRLARKYHPDVSKEKDAETRFKEVNEAYEVLGDKKKRAQYDQGSSAWGSQQNYQSSYAGSSGFGGSGFSQHQNSGFGDFFDSMFGGSQQAHNKRRKPSAPKSQTTTLYLDLEDVYEGVKKTIRLSSGVSLGVKIPKGIEEGKKIRLRGKASNGGDLYLKIKLNKHPDFTVDGKDIYVNLLLSPWEAALGDSVKVKTLSGSIKLRIPAGAYTGQKMRLRGKGLPGSVTGDQYVVINIMTPPINNNADKMFYEKMEKHFKWSPRKD